MYDPKIDPTAGGAVAAAISELIGAHVSVQAYGGSIIFVANAQEKLAKAINGYIIEPSLQRAS